LADHHGHREAASEAERREAVSEEASEAEHRAVDFADRVACRQEADLADRV
jgi:hypothetical protein